MMLVALLCLLTFLPNATVQADALLGSLLVEHTSTRFRRAASSTSSSGRPVSIPTENILNMVNVPFSTLSTSNSSVRNIIVDTHNNLRRKASPPAKNMLKMIWNNEAAKTAERWAKTCNQHHSPTEVRQIPNFGCGENLFLSSFKASWKDVIESFYSEVVDFQFGKGAKIDGQEIGHYTQVMWYSSYQVGCYVAECPSSQYQYYYVCHYCPSGNNVKSMGNPYEIGSPCGACPNGCDNGLCTNYCRVQDYYGNCKDFKGSCITDASVRKDCPATCQCNNNEIK
ncbi:serotriflin-like [Bombina bombina]|uniref:serotriflin-like n=1 Tax=Bombina bombina TaxID=8345 RepID=UPI00235A515D|nr:serotriflin-like [Bombina bombina]